MKKPRIRIIRERQINLKPLANRNITIIGFGSQGRAQALNLRDSGFTPIIGLLPNSKSRKTAHKDGFEVVVPSIAVSQADIIAVYIPDHLHSDLFDKIKNSIKKGQTFVFAHALSVHFKLVKQPKDVDFILVAPHAPGIRMREKFTNGQGVPAFIAATDKSSLRAIKLAAVYGKAIGCARAGLIQTSFAAEAIGDIFGEQAVLCGGLAGLLKSGYTTLVKGGLSPANAYLECVYQLDLIIDLIKRYGIEGMYDRISATARYGGIFAESKIINTDSKKAMAEMLKDIKNGTFIKRMLADYQNSFAKQNHTRKKNANRSLDQMAEFFNKSFSD
jgi:ketol-acid reductoisomerase